MLRSFFRALVLLLAAALVKTSPAAAFEDGPPASGQHPAFPGQTRAPAALHSNYHVVVVASGLERPWSLAFLPDGRMLVTERPGRLRIVGTTGALSPPVAGAPNVVAESQGGMLDIALDPKFPSNQLIYLSYLEPRPGGLDAISVARARLVEQNGPPRLEGFTVILRTEPAAPDGINVGSRLAFGPDGSLYVTTGDRMVLRDHAQNLGDDVGKVVRIAPDGSIPRDNPFIGRKEARPEIFSYGHRNPEGLTVDPWTGVLWELEHGAKGGDEINILRPGKNYGWPVITYGVDYSDAKIGVGTQHEGMEQPIYYWDPSIAPSGLTFYSADLFPNWKGNLFVGALKAERLVRLVLNGERVSSEEVLLDELHERIRDVRQGRDGALYVLTDNDAGRILKLVP